MSEAVVGWRRRADAAEVSGSVDEVIALLRERDALERDQDETEVEAERLQARLDVLALEARLLAGGPPEVTTQHKALGADRCYFLAPAVWYAQAGETPGKLFLTDVRLRFVGGSGVTLRWSAVARADRRERDLVVASHGGAQERFRCNTYTDAALAARLVSHFLEGRRTSASG